ncbi:OadG family protein [Clostridium sp. D33t1_170424_F3]|uniref:OadG family protein n=1 Tax=Clostridium sp. D33t1_170424_F3 TaxID=2787099 RepID=UPI0018AC7595|nr:OadG family protein [Clostridium sp. D33t1_170424_F3]
MDPQNEVLLSLTVLLTGLVVVFAMLVFLTIVIKVYGGAIHSMMKKKASNKTQAEEKPAPVAAPAPKPAIAVEEGISGEVVAAIAAAVYMTYGSAAPAIRSVKRAASNPRSIWGEAGRLENTRPF